VLSFAEKSIRDIFEMIPAIYTKSEVSIGEKWSTDGKSYFGLLPKIKITYELKEAINNYLIIKGLANYNGSNSQIKSIPDMTGVTSTMTSDIKINKKTGCIIDANIHQKVKGPMSSKNDQEKTNVNNQMTVDLEITFSDK
jgi:sporulation protein YlmC with PRC-barrel domain